VRAGARLKEGQIVLAQVHQDRELRRKESMYAAYARAVLARLQENDLRLKEEPQPPVALRSAYF